MPKEHIVEDYENDGNLGSRFHTSEFDLVSWEARAGYGAGWRRAAKKRLLSPGYDRETPKDETLFVAGDRVFHQKFGMGDVLSVEGEKLLISFDKAGRKRVVSGFVSKG